MSKIPLEKEDFLLLQEFGSSFFIHLFQYKSLLAHFCNCYSLEQIRIQPTQASITLLLVACLRRS